MKRLTSTIHLKKGGPVAQRTAQLLADRTLSLEDIATRVKKDVKGAKTSARSVASVAASLRREGYNVADRRHHVH